MLRKKRSLTRTNSKIYLKINLCSAERPEDTAEVDTDETPAPSKDTGYTLNVKKKEEFNENEFEDLFKD